MYLYTSGEEEATPQRVSRAPPFELCALLIIQSAKYIEGLENRLGRMEHLLRLSGLLAEDDDGRTDLGTLERRLVDKANNRETPPRKSPKAATVTSPEEEELEDNSTMDDDPREISEKPDASRNGTPNGTPQSQSKTPAPASASAPASAPARAPSQPKSPKVTASSATKKASPLQEEPEEEVEALSDMMCSLVTNNCGETRYIGLWTV